MTAAIFDLDGTLIPSPSAEWRLIRALMRAGLSAAAVLRCLTESAGLRLSSGDRQFNRNYLMRVDDQDIYAIAHSLAIKLAREVSSPACNLIESHRRAGHELVLVSGTVPLLVNELVPILGFDIGAAADKSTAKVEVLSKLVSSRACDLARSYAYANQSTDAKLLSAIGNPTAVNPDRRLLKIARDNNWPVLWWEAAARRQSIAQAFSTMELVR